MRNPNGKPATLISVMDLPRSEQPDTGARGEVLEDPGSPCGPRVRPHGPPSPSSTEVMKQFSGQALATRFRVIEELGRGGMGAVERVIDTSTGLEVALKRLLVGGLEGRSAAKRVALFEREYYTLSQLSHPRIIKVFDYGVDEVGPYYTMELLDGHDLRAQVPLPWQEMCRIGRDVASSLAILHARHIVHRDVTPGNIRCGDNGHAKLLDFGVMAPMGVVKEIYGTAPFVAPEMLKAGVLDGRADLFALGVTLYFAVTGRYPYPRGTIACLGDGWDRPAIEVQALCPDVPDGFNELVMGLVSVDPVARPQTAAVVFERLCMIGELVRDEVLEVAGAYLSVPTLTGRAEALDRCRSWLLNASRGSGRSVIVSSEAGVGRSRLLDSIVIEAKLLGAITVRADRSDSGEFGVVQRLAAALVEAQPEALPEDVSLRALVTGEPPYGGRGRLVANLNAWLLDCASKWPIVLVVDDVHMIDGPSLAALGALAGDLRRSALLMVCASTDGAHCRSPAALGLLTGGSRRLALKPLTALETRGLLASIFSEADNLDVLSSVLYAHAAGNASLTMRSAQALVDAGKLRYVSGAWGLPAEAKSLLAALPKDASLVAQLSGLGDDAHSLALLTALDVHEVIGLPDYGILLGGRAAPSVHDALQKLSKARILVEGATRFTLAREGYRAEIQAACSPSVRREAHLRLAAWFESRQHPPAAAYHFGRAGDWNRLLALLETTCLASDAEYRWDLDPTVTETLERLIYACDEREPAPACLLALRCRFLMLCAERHEWVRLFPHVPAVLAGLEERCGLVDYTDLADVPQGERLGAAIARAEARYVGAGGARGGGLTLLEALTELPGAIAVGASLAVLALDVELAASLPSLEPLFPLSPAFPLVQRLVDSIVACCRGRVDTALAGCRNVFQELHAGQVTGLTKASHASLLRFAQGFLQGIEASMGRPEVLDRADLSTGRRPKTIARERHAYYVAIGDLEQATAARQRLEQLEIAGGAENTFPANWETEYSNYSLTGNLPGLKRCERQAMQVAEQMPNWCVRVELTRVAQAFCGGSTEAALARARALRGRTVSGTSDDRYAVFLCFEGLFGLKRYEECRQLVQGALDGLGRPCDWFDAFEVFLARAEAALGLHDSARIRAERYGRMYQQSGVRGVLVGRTYEELARIGILIGDIALFRANAERCAAEYKCGYNPVLTARYEFLIREARARQISITDTLAHAAEYADRAPVSMLVAEFNTRLSTCLRTVDRLSTVLALAVERSGAGGGFLYISRNAGLTLVASEGFRGKPNGLDAEVESYWRSETDTELLTLTGFNLLDGRTAGTGPGPSGPGPSGQRFAAILLTDDNQQTPRGCGVLILTAPRGQSLRLDSNVTAALTRLIHRDEDVVALPVV